MAIPLEDNFADIVSKAMRGLQLTDAQVAEAAGVAPLAVNALRQGEWDDSTARAIAAVLQLNAEALAAAGQQSWQPEPVALEGLAQFNMPFDEMTVNSYVVWDPATKEAAAFDTGADAGDLLQLAAEKALRLGAVFLTHTHGDHIFDLDRLREKTGAPAYVGDREPLEGAETFAAGRTFKIGNLSVKTLLTWGHSKGAITYVVTGLARPVAVVGDALFAGSMGGGGVSYAAAIETNHREIFSLPEETIICPGHGPMTTVGEEKRWNPFYRASARS